MTTLGSSPATMKYITVLTLFVLVSSCQSGGGRGEYYSIQGFTQGTTYHITYQHPTEYDLKERVDSLLKAFDQSLSTYQPTSIISAINRNQENVATRILRRSKESDKPVVVCINASSAYDTLVNILEDGGIPTFASVERAMFCLDKLVSYRSGEV